MFYNYIVACQIVIKIEYVRKLYRAEVRINMPYNQIVTYQIVTKDISPDNFIKNRKKYFKINFGETY